MSLHLWHLIDFLVYFLSICFNNLLKISISFKVLQLFETMSSKYLKYSSDYYQKLESELRKSGFLKTILCNATENIDPNDILKDNMSHFILRLAYCKT